MDDFLRTRPRPDNEPQNVLRSRARTKAKLAENWRRQNRKKLEEIESAAKKFNSR